MKKQTLEICLAGVKQDGCALEYVKKQTQEICLAAVRQNGNALRYVKEQTSALRYVRNKTPELCAIATNQNKTMKCPKCGSELLSTGMCSNLMCDYIASASDIRVAKKEKQVVESNCNQETLIVCILEGCGGDRICEIQKELGIVALDKTNRAIFEQMGVENFVNSLYAEVKESCYDFIFLPVDTKLLDELDKREMRYVVVVAEVGQCYADKYYYNPLDHWKFLCHDFKKRTREEMAWST